MGRTSQNALGKAIAQGGSNEYVALCRIFPHSPVTMLSPRTPEDIGKGSPPINVGHTSCLASCQGIGSGGECDFTSFHPTSSGLYHPWAPA